MENSVLSSPKETNDQSCREEEEEEDLPEESSWTDYLADFSDDNISSSSSFISASMVSDAGSGPEWKQWNCNNINININNTFGGLHNIPRRLNFKKKRTQEISYDDSLEDTASSPVNSPKITMSFRRMDLNSKMMDDNQDIEMGKGSRVDDDANYNMNNKEQEFNEQLNKKGLCLMPVSMVFNYLN